MDRSEPQTITVVAPVAWFALQMQAKLEANAHKGTWMHDHPLELLARLQEEAGELAAAVLSGKGITGEAADVGNFAMMVATVCEARATSISFASYAHDDNAADCPCNECRFFGDAGRCEFCGGDALPCPCLLATADREVGPVS